ncbi:MAG: DUF896 domain-containing protein [Clostridiales bacterium]|nr:DUF896 domain-containing protein [Clostridiales bacterium]
MTESKTKNKDNKFVRITEEEILRINQLARKAKSSSGLTGAEEKEQKILRRKYIDSFKANLKNHLDMIKK